MKTQFTLKPFKLVDPAGPSIVTAGGSNGSFLVSLAGGEVQRIFPSQNCETEKIRVGSRESVVGVYVSVFHAVLATSGADTFYLPLTSTTAIALPRLKASVVTCLAWGEESDESTAKFFVGCQNGKVFSVIIEAKKEKFVSLLCEFPERLVDILVVGSACYLSTSNSLFKVGLGGGSPVLICESPVASLSNKLVAEDSSQIHWLTAVGIVTVAADLSHTVLAHSTILSVRAPVCKPEGEVHVFTPKSLVVTEFHFVVLYEEGKLAVVSKIAGGAAVSVLATAQFGSKLSLLCEGRNSVYVYSDKRVFQMAIANESADAWLHYLKKRNFPAALAATSLKAQRAFVLRTEAEFTLGLDLPDRVSLASELFAKALMEDQPSIDPIIDEIMLKLSADKLALLNFLSRKLDMAGLACDDSGALTVQVSVLFLVCCQLYIDVLLTDCTLLEPFLGFVAEKYGSLDLECLRALTEMLESVGLFEAVVRVAELTGDLATAVRVDLQRGNFAGVVARRDQQLLSDLGPVLFRFCPTEFTALPGQRDPTVFACGALTHEHRELALRSLQQTANDTDSLNALVHLTASIAPTELPSLLESMHAKSYFDAEFAVRTVRQFGLVQAEIALLGISGCRVAAVKRALQEGEVELAKSCAWKSSQCWLLILEFHATPEIGPSALIELFHEAQVVDVIEFLPILERTGADSIDLVRPEIAALVANLEQSRAAVCKEIGDYEEALQLIRKDLNTKPNTCLVLSYSQKCDLCFKLVFTEKFVAFNCTHCFHTECLKDAFAAKLVGVANADEIIEACCCLCSDSLLLEQIYEPFIDPAFDGNAIDAWTVR